MKQRTSIACLLFLLVLPFFIQAHQKDEALTSDEVDSQASTTIPAEANIDINYVDRQGVVVSKSAPAYTTVAYEIYHWVDETGVPNFSQNAPGGEVPGVQRMQLPESAPPTSDPEEDLYGVQIQAERMAALREEMEKRRASSRERRRYSQQQAPVHYREPERSYYGGFWNPPFRPGPPQRPQPPIVEPYPISTLKPPGH